MRSSESGSSANMEIWDALGRTSPEHTKPFQRSGGFKGTAVKPAYTEQKMTEQFGPCGVGWGVTAPAFQLVPGSDGQAVVFCTLSLWFVRDGKRSEPVPGVGGDMVVVKQSAGLRTDDEAFKKAFTDALGNAMKHIGMSADVHLGRFDDNKYVNDLRREDAEQRQRPQARTAPPPQQQAAPAPRTVEENGRLIDADTGEDLGPAEPKATGRQVEELRQLMKQAGGAIKAGLEDKWLRTAGVKSLEDMSSNAILKCTRYVRGLMDAAPHPAASNAA